MNCSFPYLGNQPLDMPIRGHEADERLIDMLLFLSVKRLEDG